ncbi:ketopantoate reductase PanE/ApbA C terminal-domain-containing protein [Kickxella alabastrina]|uniref:ketopantoate reductase PanE/ApbA C terminal-domain-containing protein n=1 Tax=Kickxella alabastrina TaxID=61397 RepID=UPI00222058E7|nr:ketopantoate reductase PanE/ApbA C terminal-domain-containing protein [Kickxella alabastrina]KAI7830930.1 ketopantoate reductase PanE/ApbA C terminal-domain-containing protein [Kickxella alabastrina]
MSLKSPITYLRVHVLGAGAVGLLFGAHLRQSGHSITLVLRSQASVDRFSRSGSCIGVVNDWVRTQPSRKLLFPGESSSSGLAPWLANGVDAETPEPNCSAAEVAKDSRESGKIGQLILATKAQDTLQAYRSVKDRLSSQSTVVLLQNGMGTYEAIQREFYTSPQQRQKELLVSEVPSFIIGTNSHGCLRNPVKGEEFVTHYTAIGSCSFAVRPSLLNPPPVLPQSTLDMLTALGGLSLNTSITSWSDLHLQLMLKLAANATINPVTALTDCRNGYLAPPPPDESAQCVDQGYYESMRNYLSSACVEIAAIYARAQPHLHEKLSAHVIEEYVTDIARMTAKNRSSMLQDVAAQRQTEVEWINGYLVRLGKQHGVPTPVNTLLYTLVKLKEAANYHTCE